MATGINGSAVEGHSERRAHTGDRQGKLEWNFAEKEATYQRGPIKTILKAKLIR